MTTTYTYSLSTDFGNVLNQSQLHDEITKVAIAPICYSVKNNKDSPDDVNIDFDISLTPEEKTTLDTLVSSHVLITNAPGPQFDAVVSANGDHEYITISEAIADGHTHIMVRKGWYTEPTGFNFSGVSITGENGVDCIVYLAGQAASVRADATLGVKEDVGTISATQYSKIIVGIGTTFTNVVVGNFITLGTNYFEIASIEDDTHLTLVDTYVGGAMSNMTYIAQAMATGTHMSNILIVGSAASGLFMRGQRHYFLDSVAVKSCLNGFEIVDCGDSSARQTISESCGNSGMLISNCVSLAFSVIDSYNHPVNGLHLTGTNLSIVFAQCELTSCGYDGVRIEGTAEDIALVNCVMKYNGHDGIYVGPNCQTIAITNAVACRNGNIGANLDGEGIKLSSGNSCDNGGVGVILNGLDSSCSNMTVKDNTHGIYVSADDCRVTDNRCKNNALSGLYIDTGVLDTIATPNNLKGNTGTNLTDNGTGSDTTGCKI